MKGFSPRQSASAEPAPLSSSGGLSGAQIPWVLEWIPVFALTLMGAALCAYGLASKTFWLDEGMSVGIARLDWYNFVRILWRREGNMSLYYFLLHFWLHLGNGEAFVRTLSVIFAIATVPAIYLLGRRLFSRRAGLAAAALLAVNAFHIRWAQEARSYSLLVLLCALSSLFLLRSLDAPTRGNRIAWILFSVLAVYAHFFAGLVVVAQWISLGWIEPRSRSLQRDFRWIGLGVSPLVVFVAKTGAGPLRWVQRPGLGDLWDLALQLTGRGGVLLLVLYALACGVTVADARETWNAWKVTRDVWRLRFLLLWLVFPPLLIFLLSFARPLFVPRYFIFCLPPLMVLAAGGLTRLRPSWAWAPAALLMVGLSLFGTISHRNDFDPERDDWRSTSSYVLNNAEPGDALVFHIAAARMPYEFYRSLEKAAPSTPQVLYPHSGARITYLDFVAKPDYATLERALPQYRRVWLVLSHAENAGVPDQINSALSSILGDRYSTVAAYHFQGIEVRLYSGNRHN